MNENYQKVPILMADDDEEDRLLTQEAMEGTELLNLLRFVEDGEQLMHYLTGEGEYSDREAFPLPGLILLDLNMPKKDGRECLKIIKADPKLRHIPIVILTTSKAERDILESYNLGANSFITKPVTFGSLVETMETVRKYWIQIVKLPKS